MYYKAEYTGITCDNCGKVYMDEHTGFAVYVDESAAHDAADNDEWYSWENKHYCPDCHTWDDEDNLIINELNKDK